MEDDYDRPAYLDMSPAYLAALGEPMAYTDMGDDPATIKALDDAEDFDGLLSRSSVGGGPLTADRVSAKYRMTVDEAQAMIDAGAVESGGILFVNAEARDSFYTAIGGVDPSNPFADAYAAVMRDEVARADAAAASDDDLDDGPGYHFTCGHGPGFQCIECLPDDDESYAHKVNAPLTEAEAREIGRQIASGDYPRFNRSTVHKTARGGVTTTVHVSQPVRRCADDDDPGWDDYAAAMARCADDVMDGDGADVIATLDAAVADGTAGTTVAPPLRFNPNGFIECANIEGQLWSSIADDYEPEHESDPMFHIWSNKHQLYWGPDRKGYVAWPSQAGQYTAVEASAIINHSMRGIILGQNRAVPDSIMLPVPDTIPDGAQ